LKLADVVQVLETVAPTGAAAAWDNVGLLAGDPAAEVTRALVAIDATLEVVEEAARERCELLVAYHPPIFAPLRAVLPSGDGAAAFAALRRGVALYSPHTALDAADGGTNDVLADALGMAAERAPLARVEARARGTTTGMGRVGAVARAPRRELVARAKAALGVAHALVAGPLDGDASLAAVCAGAGGDFVGAAIDRGADVYLTGELRHHEALRAARAGMTVVCVLHSNSERPALSRYAARLAAASPGVAFVESRADADPFTFA
jgi:dinuclear metal center YbgI/SA1388 family protein